MKKLLFPLPVGIDNNNYLSGTLLSIYNALSSHFEVITVGPLHHSKNVMHMGMNVLKNKYGLFPWRFATMHSWKTVESFAKQLEDLTDSIQYDAVFSVSTLYAGAFKTDKPSFAYTDFSFYNAIDYYDFGIDLYGSSKMQAIEVDKHCFTNYDKVFLGSQWSKKTTEDAYGLPNDKIISVARGANLTSGFCNNDVKEVIKKRVTNKNKEFLFVGVDWNRKGGDVAFKVIEALRKNGHNITLNIVGCKPEKAVAEKEFVTVYPFFNRKDSKEKQELLDLFTNAFLYIMPTRAEAMGIVFAEAASFALPCVAYNTGGVSEAVVDNETGILFDIDSSFDEKVSRVEKLINSDEEYSLMSKKSFEHYEKNLNWDSIILKIKEIIDPIIENNNT